MSSTTFLIEAKLLLGEERTTYAYSLKDNMTFEELQEFVYNGLVVFGSFLDFQKKISAEFPSDVTLSMRSLERR